MQHPHLWIVVHGLALLAYLALARRWILDLGSFPVLEPRGPLPLPDPAPTVSVLVPARDEAANVGACLDGILGQEYPALEVVLVDDQSTDRTGSIAAERAGRDPRLRIVPGTERPEGWAGKNWAIHVGSQEATGEYLLIVDADTGLAPRAVPEAVARAHAGGLDLLSVFPRIAVRSFWERAFFPALSLIPSYRLDRINDPDSKDANAVGYFLLFRRSAFDAFGGYEAIKGRVGEDWWIARHMKETGRRIEMHLAPELVTKGFGPGLDEIWQGFVKNFMLILDGRRGLAALAWPFVTLLALFLVLPWLGLGQAAWVLLAGPSWKVAAALAGLAVCELMAVQAIRRLMQTTIGLDERGVGLQPLGALVILVMWTVAIVRTMLGLGLVWRGRRYREL